MDRKGAYGLFPPKSPTRSRQTGDRRRRSTSLDPLPPIEEPPHVPPVPDSEQPDSPTLKPIHSLYNPRPPSRRTPSDQPRQPPPYSIDTQPQPPHPPHPPVEQNSSSSRRSSLKYHKSPSPQTDQYQYPDQLPPPPPRPHTSQEMHAPSPSTASSISLQKPPIPATANHIPMKSTKNAQPRVAYFHGGIGGRGNYRKVVRENNRAPLAHARNVSPPGRSRFLSGLFGSGRRRRSPSGENGEQGSGRSSEESSRSGEQEEVALGAAEVMRRKLLRQAGLRPKNSRNGSMENI